VSSDVVGDNSNGWMSFGCTLAVRPDVTIAEKVAEWEEGVILVDIV
jgi:hypothetical protein